MKRVHNDQMLFIFILSQGRKDFINNNYITLLSITSYPFFILIPFHNNTDHNRHTFHSLVLGKTLESHDLWDFEVIRVFFSFPLLVNRTDLIFFLKLSRILKSHPHFLSTTHLNGSLLYTPSSCSCCKDFPTVVCNSDVSTD